MGLELRRRCEQQRANPLAHVLRRRQLHRDADRDGRRRGQRRGVARRGRRGVSTVHVCDHADEPVRALRRRDRFGRRDDAHRLRVDGHEQRRVGDRDRRRIW